MRSFFVILLLALINMVLTAAIINKPYRLRILNLVDDEALMTYRYMAELAADSANSRSDILPDYHVEMQYEDEAYGTYAPNVLVNYRREGENDSLEYYQAPIMIGPPFSAGCKSVGPFLEYVDMVSQTAGCGAGVLWNHVRYHNLYMMMNTAFHMSLGMLRFIKDIGWNRFSIFTYAASPNDYGGAMLLQQMAMQSNMTVPWFSMFMNIDEIPELVRSLKASNPRVTAVVTGTDFALYGFLCEAYKAGIKGPRYPFIAYSAAVAEPFETPQDYFPGCKRSQIFEQLKNTIFADNAINLENKTWRSEFGQSQKEFDLYIQKAANLSRPPDDSYRYVYYDAQVKTIMALHNTEEQLKKQNFSLRDFRRFPQLVMKVANASLLNLNIAGLHIERMKFSKGGVPEGEAQSVAQWTPEKGIRNFGIGTIIHETFELSSCTMAFFDKINWTTTDGLRPRDDVIVIRTNHVVSQDIFISVVVIAALMVICKLSIFVAAHVTKQIRHTAPITQAIGYLGCLLVDGAAICFAIDVQDVGLAYTRSVVAIVLLTIGLAMSHGTLAFRGAVIKTIEGERRAVRRGTSGAGQTRATTIMVSQSQATIGTRQTTNATAGGTSVRAEIVRPNTIDWTRLDKVAAMGTVVFVLFNAAFLACWFGIDPARCSWELFGAPLYMEKEDVLKETYIQICASQQMVAWAISLTFIHAAVLAIGCWLAYLAKELLKNCAEYPYIRFGISNAATLVLGDLLVVIVIRNPVAQQIAIAYGALLNSALTTICWLFSSIKTPVSSAGYVSG